MGILRQEAQRALWKVLLRHSPRLSSVRPSWRTTSRWRCADFSGDNACTLSWNSLADASMAISEFILLNGNQRFSHSPDRLLHAIHRGTKVGSPTRTCAPGARFSPDTAISDGSLLLTRHSRQPLPDRCMAISLCELLTHMVGPAPLPLEGSGEALYLGF